MREFIAGLFQPENLAEGSREGLPYWIFWLLLLVIVLLLAFIFLRDKDLRRRLDSFFSGLRNRIVKLRLHTILKREKAKQEIFVTDLGRSAWDAKILIEGGGILNEEINALQVRLQDLQKEKQSHEAKIDELRRSLDQFKQAQQDRVQRIESEKIPFKEELEKIRAEEKEISTDVTRLQSLREETMQQINRVPRDQENAAPKREAGDAEEASSLETRLSGIDNDINAQVRKKAEREKAAERIRADIDTVEQKIKALNEETKSETRSLQKEIKEWEKNLSKVRDRIKGVEDKKLPLFTGLGRMINEQRVEHQDLTGLYSKIDRSLRRIGDLEKQIQNLE